MVKVGDKVRSLVTEFDVRKGGIYEVETVGSDGAWVIDDVEDDYYLCSDQFEPVAVADSNGSQHGNQPKFKVGDRVRALDSCGGGGFVAGDEYIVSRVYEDFSGKRISVEVDSAGSKTNGWGVQHFELVDVPLTIREGGYYRTRDGRKVGPMEGSGSWFDSEYPFTVSHSFDGEDYGKAWRKDGTFNPVERRDHPADLIAEWTDEPAATTTSAPKFKVGDRVATDGGYTFDPNEGVIVKNNVDDDSNLYKVDVPGTDSFDGDGWHYRTHQLRLVAEATSGKDDEPDAIARIRMCDVIEAKEMARAGIFTINEVRKKFGLPPIVNGEALAA